MSTQVLSGGRPFTGITEDAQPIEKIQINNGPCPSTQPYLSRPKRVYSELRTADGWVVHNRPHSHVTKIPYDMLQEVIASINAAGRVYIQKETTYDDIIGESVVVETFPGDKIVYAIRKNRRKYDRFVLDRAPAPTDKISVIMKKCEENDYAYVLISAWFGPLTPPSASDMYKESVRTGQPTPTTALVNSAKHWLNHAYVLSHCEIEPGSLVDTDNPAMLTARPPSRFMRRPERRDPNTGIRRKPRIIS